VQRFVGIKGTEVSDLPTGIKLAKRIK